MNLQTAQPALAAESAEVNASTEEEKIKTVLNPVVVSASGFEQGIDDAQASITIITREELEKRPFNNLADAVRGVTGISYIGGSGNDRDISMRGLPGDYTLIMVDGKRQSTRESRVNGSGGYEAGFIPPLEAIERIEIIRGPMSTLYGSDAMGGVINIITRKSDQKWRGSIGLDHTFQEDSDSGDISTGNFFLSGPLWKDKLAVQLMGGANLRAEDEIINGYYKNDNKNVTGKFFFTPVEQHEFILELGRNLQKREYSAGKSSTSSGSTQTARNNWGVTYNADWDIAVSSLKVYQEQAKWIRTTRRLELTNTVGEGQATFNLPMNMLTIGGQYKKSKLEDSSVTGSGGSSWSANTKIDAYQYAVFLEDEFSILDNLALTGGIRVDDHEHFGDYWSPRGYIVYHPIKDITIKGGVAKGFKAPDLRQLDSSYGYSTNGGAAVMYGDPDLDPETSLNYEASVTYHNDYGIRASVTGFHTNFKNKLTNYNTGLIDPITGLRLFKHDNIGKARIQGIESGITIPLPAELEFVANYTYMDSEQRTDENGAKGQPLTMTPKHAYNLRLNWQALDELSLYTLIEYTGTQTYTGLRNGNGGLPRYRQAYTTFDVGGTYKVNDNTRLNFGILNITDQREDEPTDATGANWDVIEDGRRYWVGINADF